MSSKISEKHDKKRFKILKEFASQRRKFNESHDTENRPHKVPSKLNYPTTNQELCSVIIPAAIPSSSQLQNNNIIVEDSMNDDHEHDVNNLSDTSDIDSFITDDSFTNDDSSNIVSTQMIPFGISDIRENSIDGLGILHDQFSDQSTIYRKLYLGLFLQQSHSDLSDRDVVIQARLHSLVHHLDDVPQSYETLKKRGKIFQPIVHKYLYNKCGLIGPLTPQQITLNKEIYCNKICNCSIVPNDQMEAYFCYVKLKEYLQYMIPEVHHLLRFNKSLPSDQPAETIHDIVDGSRYRQLAGEDTIVVYFGFDGVQYVETPTPKSIWPLVIYICELPFNLRQKFAFPLAIHAGQKQPSNIMLQPFIDELVEHFTKPIKFAVKIDNKIQTKELRVKLLLGICDAPARAKVLNMKQHNGYYGCNFCKILCSTNKDINCMMYPMNLDFELRTDEEWRTLALRTEEVKITRLNERQFFGIKGTTPLMDLPYVNLVSVCPPEFMHSQFLGTVNLLLRHWLGARTTAKSLDSAVLNARLKQLKFPSRILRVMPDITKPLKSIELENLLYYGFVLLEGLLPEEEFTNFKLFALIISTLSSREIFQSQIDKCEEWIKTFITEFGRLYPTELHKYNVHMLCHLPQVVREFGPLITNSAYQVENSMGKIAKQVQTGIKVPEQVMNKTCMISSTVVNFFANIDTFDDDYINYILKSFFPFLMEDQEKLKVKEKRYKLSPDETEMLSKIDPIQITTKTKVHNIDKITYNKFIVSTNDYSTQNNELTNNQYIKTKSGKYLQVYKIIRVQDNVYLLCYEYTNLQKYSVSEGIEFQHVKYTKQMSKLQMIKSSDIDCPFSLVTFNRTFILFDLFNRHI